MTAPLSYGQQRLWFFNALHGPNAMYNVPLAFRLSGPLNRGALQAALCDLVDRHEVLRTVYPEAAGQPSQRVIPAGAARLELPASPVDEHDLRETLRQAAACPVDITVDLPVRAWLFALAPEEHVLLLVMHHIASDAGSLGPLERDLGRAYTARLAGQKPGWPPLPIQYRDYVAWQRELLGSAEDPASLLRTQLDFWVAALAGLPERIELPADRPRPEVPSLRGDSVPVAVPARVHAGLLAVARQSRATLFMVVQAALAVLYHHLGAGTDIPLGAPVAGRSDRAIEDLVGFFVNTIVLRMDLSGDPTFRELVARVRRTNLVAYAHQDLPFDLLVQRLKPSRSLGCHPLFQTMVTLHYGAPAGLEMPGLRVRLEDLNPQVSLFDIAVSLTERYSADRVPAGLHGYLVYSSDLFEPDTAALLADRLNRLLAAVAADPDGRMRELGRRDESCSTKSFI